MATDTHDRLATLEARTGGTPGASPDGAPTSRGGGGLHELLRPVLGVAALLTVLVSAFAWPAVNTAPRSLPIAVVAPGPVAQQVSGRLAAAAGPDAFDVTVLPDADAARRAVLDRDVYGALVLGPSGSQVLVASAASPAVAQALRGLAAELPAESGGPATVTDVVPLPADDPRGLGLPSGLLPLVVGGMALGAVTALRVAGRLRRVAVLLAGALTGGAVVVALLQGWLGALDGSPWVLTGVASLVVLAVAAAAAGLHRLLGVAGIALTALVAVVLGNPLSGAASAPEMLPDGWGTLGAFLPAGAGATALRSWSFFDGAGATTAVWVLVAWALTGLVLVLLPRRGQTRAA